MYIYTTIIVVISVNLKKNSITLFFNNEVTICESRRIKSIIHSIRTVNFLFLLLSTYNNKDYVYNNLYYYIY